MRLNTSIELFAWIVDSEPSLPWLIALSMVTISSPSTSPTMTRLGFMRRLRRTSSAIAIRPLPSELGSRSSNATTFGCRSGNSPRPELERPLDRDEPLLRRDLVGERAQQGRLPGVRRAGDHDVLARQHRGRQEAGHVGRDRAEPHEVVEVHAREPRATDRDRRAGAHVHDRRQAAAVRQAQVELRVGRVERAARQARVRAEDLHELDQLVVGVRDRLPALLAAVARTARRRCRSR